MSTTTEVRKKLQAHDALDVLLDAVDANDLALDDFDVELRFVKDEEGCLKHYDYTAHLREVSGNLEIESSRLWMPTYSASDGHFLYERRTDDLVEGATPLLTDEQLIDLAECAFNHYATGDFKTTTVETGEEVEWPLPDIDVDLHYTIFRLIGHPEFLKRVGGLILQMRHYNGQ